MTTKKLIMGGFVRCAAMALSVVSTCIGAGCSQDPQWIAHGRTAMVASDHPEASRVGARILSEGGNAVDAAVAVSFALAVTRPQSTGLGGGGFMIVRMADTGDVVVLDYRETAPASATADMFDRAVAEAPGDAPPSIYGHRAVAVPGQLSGLTAVLNQFGTRPLADLVAPAIRLAEKGVAVDEHYVKATREVLKIYEQYAELRESCPYVYELHLRQGRLRAVGDRLRQPQLARLLRAVAEEGPAVLKQGAPAAAIEREMTTHGGLITCLDLSSYHVVERGALKSKYRGYEIVAMPLPSSGGVCLIEALNILETVDLPELARSNRPLAMHFMAEAMKHAFADRARWLADGDFVHVPTGLLTSKTYGQLLAEGLDATATADGDTYGLLQIPEDSGTSHFCVVDRWGNCVVSTETINTAFGSLAAVGEWGLILNNEMDDFTAHPGRANAYNLTQATRNVVEPHKRPLSSMTPTIVLSEGRPVLLLGGSGGPRIISSVLNVLVRVLDFGMSLEDAMKARRIHHQWQPDLVYFDRDPDPVVADALRVRGHEIADGHKTGVVQAIHCREDKLIGASDPRKQGKPAGY